MTGEPRNNMSENRNLTDADVTAICDELEQRITKKFYLDLGKGVWNTVWKLVVTGVIIIAAYGASKGLPQ